MPVLTLLAAPERADLTDAALTEALHRRGGRHADPRWLSPGVAAEAEVGGDAVLDEDEWALWQERGFDLALQPDGPRRRRVLVADMDSTMIEQECIDELAAHAGVGEQVSQITARAMNGELDFAAALHERVALLKGLPTSVADLVLAERITLMPGGTELVGTMRAHGARTALVSGGFTLFTRVVAERLGFDEHRANTLASQDGRLTGAVVLPVLGKQAKLEALEELIAGFGRTPQDAVAVGDGANDLPMLQRAGLGVALHAKPVVARRVPVRVNHGDLTAVLYLQGYSSSEFAHPS